MQRFTLSAGVILSLAFGFATNANAVPISISPSEPVLVIDGNGDADVTVTISFFDGTSGFDFGYVDGGFTAILLDSAGFSAVETFSGGDVLDFAIRDTTTGDVFALSDGTAEMNFDGVIPASISEKPVVAFDYYSELQIIWGVAGQDFVISLADDLGDGFAPASYAIGPHVPEPSAALVFGLGFVVLGRVVRRNMRR